MGARPCLQPWALTWMKSQFFSPMIGTMLLICLHLWSMRWHLGIIHLNFPPGQWHQGGGKWLSDQQHSPHHQDGGLRGEGQPAEGGTYLPSIWLARWELSLWLKRYHYEVSIYALNSYNFLLGKTFLNLWAQYRYGVYEEHGYPNDMRYPLIYYERRNSTEPVPNACSNVPLEGEYK